jgi:hypothetical protein
MGYSEGSTGKSRGKRATNKVPLSARARLSLAFAVLAGALNCFFGISAIAQDTPSEGPKLADDIHETIDKVPVRVTLLSGKTYTGPMIVTHYRPDGPGPFPIVIFNHGRPATKEQRAMPPRQRYTRRRSLLDQARLRSICANAARLWG